jgi:hypothetical protein
MNLKTTLFLSMQRALLGMIYPSIKGIAVGYEEQKKLKVICYLDREPNEDDYENISDVTGEVCADIDFLEVEEICIHTQEPTNSLNCLNGWVYLRKELPSD